MLACTLIPFIYYATSVYQYAHENKPEGYKYPEIKQLWMTGVGICTYKMIEELVYCVTRPIFSRLLKEQPDQETFNRKVDKCCSNLNGFIFHSTAAYWGWHVMKNSNWLPWWMGGLNPQGDMENAF